VFLSFCLLKNDIFILKNICKNELKTVARVLQSYCGLMGNLLTLDCKSFKNVRLIDIDLDLNSLKQTTEYSKKLDIPTNIEFKQANA
jgi:hypothetical protein